MSYPSTCFNDSFDPLQSADVIHSFWLPQLNGKTDLIPTGKMRHVSIPIFRQLRGCVTQHANNAPAGKIVHTPEGFQANGEHSKSQRLFPAIGAGVAPLNKGCAPGMGARSTDFETGSYMPDMQLKGKKRSTPSSLTWKR